MSVASQIERIKNEVSTQAVKMQNILELLETKAGVEPPPLKLQSMSVVPSYRDIQVTASEGYDGLSDVTVMGDSKLNSVNIKSGISIFGVPGSLIPAESNVVVKKGIVTVGRKYTEALPVNYNVGWIPNVIMFYRTTGASTVEQLLEVIYQKEYTGQVLPYTNIIMYTLNSASDVRTFFGNRGGITNVTGASFFVVPYTDNNTGVSLTIEAGNYAWIAIRFLSQT